MALGTPLKLGIGSEEAYLVSALSLSCGWTRCCYLAPCPLKSRPFALAALAVQGGVDGVAELLQCGRERGLLVCLRGLKLHL